MARGLGTFDDGDSARDEIPSYLRVREHFNSKQVHLRASHVLLAEAQVIFRVLGEVHR